MSWFTDIFQNVSNVKLCEVLATVVEKHPTEAAAILRTVASVVDMAEPAAAPLVNIGERLAEGALGVPPVTP